MSENVQILIDEISSLISENNQQRPLLSEVDEFEKRCLPLLERISQNVPPNDEKYMNISSRFVKKLLDMIENSDEIHTYTENPLAKMLDNEAIANVIMNNKEFHTKEHEELYDAFEQKGMKIKNSIKQLLEPLKNLPKDKEAPQYYN